MRSKEVDLAINYFENKYKEFEQRLGKKVTTEEHDYIEILNNYISELEKENEKYKNFQLHISGMRSGKELLTRYIKDSILKDKIRAIKEECKKEGCCSDELKEYYDNKCVTICKYYEVCKRVDKLLGE